MFKKEPSKHEKILIEQIGSGGREREEAWQWVVQHWLPALVQPALHAGWSREAAEQGLSWTMVRVNRLVRHEIARSTIAGNFLSFLTQSVFDQVLLADMHEYRGQKAAPYMRQHWQIPLKNQFFMQPDFHGASDFERVFEDALSRLQYRVSRGYLSLNQQCLQDYLFDELLIAAILCEEPFPTRALTYIRSNWYDYLTSIVPDTAAAESKDATMDEVLIGLWKRIAHPQKEQSLILDHAFKTYLYQASKNAFLRQKKENTILMPVAANLQTYASVQEVESVPDIEKKNDRWTSLALTNKERTAIIDHLPPACRQLFILDADGFTDMQIAERLGFKAVDSVKNKRCKCNDQIEAFIQQLRAISI